MSKKWNKALFGLTAAAAVGAGVYYFLKKKDEAEFEELEEAFENDDFELEEDLEEVPTQREYVTLTPASEDVVAEEAPTTEEAAEAVSEESTEENTEEKPAE